MKEFIYPPLSVFICVQLGLPFPRRQQIKTVHPVAELRQVGRVHQSALDQNLSALICAYLRRQNAFAFVEPRASLYSSTTHAPPSNTARTRSAITP
jgi:hypothetical protein